jgi:hypothetical protein
MSISYTAGSIDRSRDAGISAGVIFMNQFEDNESSSQQ